MASHQKIARFRSVNESLDDHACGDGFVGAGVD